MQDRIVEYVLTNESQMWSTLISLRSKLNRRDRVSEMTFNLPGLSSTLKSYDCGAIAHRVSIFDVLSCMEYK